MSVSGQHYIVVPFSQGKNPLNPTKRRLGGPSQFKRFAEDKNFFPLPEAADYFLNFLKTDIYLNYLYNLSSYLTRNIICDYYQDLPIIATDSENHTKHINTLIQKNASLLTLQQVVL
jgi:hypothetical protein